MGIAVSNIPCAPMIDLIKLRTSSQNAAYCRFERLRDEVRPKVRRVHLTHLSSLQLGSDGSRLASYVV
jgi:hypothetical protein